MRATCSTWPRRASFPVRGSWTPRRPRARAASSQRRITSCRSGSPGSRPGSLAWTAPCAGSSTRAETSRANDGQALNATVQPAAVLRAGGDPVPRPVRSRLPRPPAGPAPVLRAVRRVHRPVHLPVPAPAPSRNAVGVDHGSPGRGLPARARVRLGRRQRGRARLRRRRRRALDAGPGVPPGPERQDRGRRSASPWPWGCQQADRPGPHPRAAARVPDPGAQAVAPPAGRPGRGRGPRSHRGHLRGLHRALGPSGQPRAARPPARDRWAAMR